MLVHSHNLIGKTIHKYILDKFGVNLSLSDLKNGCMKPDFYPKLMAIPHYKNESFGIISQMILSLQNTKLPVTSKQIRHFSNELGIILHFITDYFCYPHNNKVYDKLTAHLIYEINLHKELIKYITNNSAVIDINLNTEDCSNLNISLIHFIEEKHKQYMENSPGYLNDVVYGIQSCSVVAFSIIDTVILKSTQKAA